MPVERCDACGPFKVEAAERPVAVVAALPEKLRVASSRFPLLNGQIMLAQAGLYFPFIHFRNDDWLKAAALYWPAMARMVPLGYPTRDSDVVRELSDELDFILNLRPTGGAQDRTARLFLELLDRHGAVLSQHLGVVSACDDLGIYGAPPPEGSHLGFIYAEKLGPVLRDRLLEHGLGVVGDARNRDHGRQSMDPDPSRWIGMNERLAAVYMCVLSEEMAHTNNLAPVTDQPLAQLAVGGWSVERVAALLTGAEVLDVDSHSDDDTVPARVVAQLALSLHLPKDLRSIPVDQIVSFRRQHSADMQAFQIAVAEVVDELSGLNAAMDELVLSRYLQDVVDRCLSAPRRDLKRALGALNLDTAVSTINVQSTLPALGALGGVGIVANPVVGLAAGAGVGLVTVATQHMARRRDARKAAPAAAYLLDVQRAFDPQTSLKAGLSRLRRA